MARCFKRWVAPPGRCCVRRRTGAGRASGGSGADLRQSAPPVRSGKPVFHGQTGDTFKIAGIPRNQQKVVAPGCCRDHAIGVGHRRTCRLGCRTYVRVKCRRRFSIRQHRQRRSDHVVDTRPDPTLPLSVRKASQSVQKFMPHHRRNGHHAVIRAKRGDNPLVGSWTKQFRDDVCIEEIYNLHKSTARPASRDRTSVKGLL